MIRNQNPGGSVCSGTRTRIPLLGVNIRRNVSRIKCMEALSPSKIIPKSGGQYAPDYPQTGKYKDILGKPSEILAKDDVFLGK
jgi:hypothetical protein